jgi:hypothetical protein
MMVEGNEEMRIFMEQLTAGTNVVQYVDLPMIVILGDMNSGKTSLLSSISGVDLCGLTTQCPITLETTRSNNSSVSVNVILKSQKLEATKDFVPPTKITNTDWTSLHKAISGAHNYIIEMRGNKRVSQDIVSVKISGPHYDDLILVDLPVILRHGVDDCKTCTSEADIQSLLVDDYLNNDRCIILAIVPANVDFSRSQILAEVIKFDPETNRTVPVITKPDLIDSSLENDIRSLLS